MVEHILAALAGLRVDNCEIWVDAAEMPCGDGSSKDVVEAILQAGVVEQNTLRDELTIMRPIRVGDDQCWIEARPAHQRGLHLCYDLDFGTGHTIGRQQLQVTLDPDVFCYQLATARTFIMKGEADMMRANGIGLRTTYQNLLVFDDHGPIENQLRFPDECVRHKTLDLVGDLALANCDIHGEIHAYRSGHRLNAELVWRLLESHAVSRIFRYSA